MLNLVPQDKYPSKIHVGSEVYTIKFVRGLKCYGVTDSGDKTIKIKKGLSPRETMKTLIHELLHAVDFEHDIGIKHKKVYALEEALFGLIYDNFL